MCSSLSVLECAEHVRGRRIARQPPGRLEAHLVAARRRAPVRILRVVVDATAVGTHAPVAGCGCDGVGSENIFRLVPKTAGRDPSTLPKHPPARLPASTRQPPTS